MNSPVPDAGADIDLAGVPDSVLTFTGRLVRLDDPRPEDIDFEDIAHALSMLCRFNGHCRRFYSVAEHSIFVSHVVPRRLALLALMHDAHEAYLGDVTSPLKKKLSGYSELSKKWDVAISKRFGIRLDPPDVDVHEADMIALHYEAQCLFPPGSSRFFTQTVPASVKRYMRPLVGNREILCMPPDLAKMHFVERCIELTS